MKRSALIILLAAVVVLAGVVASTGGAQPPGGRTFKLIEEDESAAFGDVVPRSHNNRNPRFSGGDMHVFTSRLFDEANRRVGRLDAQCITVRGGRTFVQARFQCSATITLRDGTIAVNTAFRGNQRDEDVLSAVTGGTGAYEGARGSISQRNLPRGRTENTVHLFP
jgi:allene oxide cyclase-like protein